MSFASINQSRISEAPATLATNLARKKIHNVLKRRRGLSVVLDEEEIAGENLELYFTIMTGLLATTPIPINHNFDIDLNPTNSNSRCCCVTVV